MNLEYLNRAALWTCGASLVTAFALILTSIWTEAMSGEIAWKIWATVGVFFLISGAVLFITKRFHDREIDAREAT